MIENKDQLIDIYDLWYQPFWKQLWFYNIVITMTILLMVAICYFLYKKFIRINKPIDCSIKAYRQLEELKNFQIVSKQDSKYCYFKVSLVIKAYLACRYHTVFMKLTDKEIIKHVENYMPEGDIRLLQKILQGMTFVKFEHEVAITEKLEKDIQLVQDFIKNTTPLDSTKEN